METFTLSERFTLPVFEYETAFCKRMKLHKGEWIHYGNLYFVSDYYFGFNDMMLIVDKKIPEKKVIEWYDYVIDSGKPINLMPYLQGARHKTNENETKKS